MMLELSDVEQSMLLDVFRDRLGELREQIDHAGTAGAKDGLTEREDLLEGLIEWCETGAGI